MYWFLSYLAARQAHSSCTSLVKHDYFGSPLPGDVTCITPRCISESTDVLLAALGTDNALPPTATQVALHTVTTSEQIMLYHAIMEFQSTGGDHEHLCSTVSPGMDCPPPHVPRITESANSPVVADCTLQAMMGAHLVLF